MIGRPLKWQAFLLVGVFIVFCVMLTGCSITHDYRQAENIKDAGTINIITNPETKEGFLKAMTSWLGENGFKYNILPEGSSTKDKSWVLTYIGKWSWDVTIYLSKAAIEAYNNGVLAGNSTYSAGSANLSKFRNAEETIKKMMSNLFYGEKE